MTSATPSARSDECRPDALDRRVPRDRDPANTAIFSVVNALLLKPLPYPDADRLVVLWLRSPGINIPQDWPSPGQYLDIQQENRSFSEMAIPHGRVGRCSPARRFGGDAGRAAASRRARDVVERVSPAGRDAAVRSPPPCEEDSSDTRPSSSSVTHSGAARSAPILASWASSSRRTDSRIRTMPGNQYEVVGVLGPDFLMNGEIMPTVAGIRQMDVFLSLPFGPETQVKRRGDENFNIMARLKPGVTTNWRRATSRRSRAGFARRTIEAGRSRLTSCRSSSLWSAASAWRCSSSWDPSRSSCSSRAPTSPTCC